MQKPGPTRLARVKWHKWLPFAILAAFASANSQSSFGQSADAAMTDPAVQRPVHAVAVPSTNVDSQTSWTIEPEVPRIPKIPGLEPNLPPHIERRLSYAFDLAQRGATYSANAEFQVVIGLCALEVDSRTGGTSHRDVRAASGLGCH